MPVCFKVPGHLGVVEHLEMEGIYVIYMNSITEYTRSVRNGSSRSNKKSIIEWLANNFEICHQRKQHDFVYSCQCSVAAVTSVLYLICQYIL